MVKKAVTAIAVVLLWTALASGERVWVLWESVGLSDTRQTPRAAETTKEACEAESRKQLAAWRSFARMIGATVEISEHTAALHKAGEMETFTYRCLPDTIDPRAPKAK
jgi:hypothetical protein